MMYNVLTRGAPLSLLLFLSACVPDEEPMEIQPAPLLEAIAPAAASTAGGARLHLSGRRFVPGARVTIGGQAVTELTVDSDTQITATLPPRPGALGKVPVMVENPGGGRAIREDLFSYHAGSVAFPGPSIPVGTRPGRLSIADLNGDRQPDVIISGVVGRLLLSDGKGGHLPPRSISLPPSQALAVADVSGDGRMDIVAWSDHAVSVLLGNGRGDFASLPRTWAISASYGNTMALADFDGDKRLDLAIPLGSFWDMSSFVVLFGDGLGGFPTSKTFGDRSATALMQANLDGDDRPDLVVSTSGGVTTFLNNGKGGFTARHIPLAEQYSDMHEADLDGDGKADLVALRQGGLSVLLGDGQGGLVQAPGRINESIAAFGIEDFNGDGKPDVAAAGSNGLSLL